jgi:hypothetical protein
MTNWMRTSCRVEGPADDIARFKAECFYVEPSEDPNGIDFERVIPMPEVAHSGWSKATQYARYSICRGDELYLITAWDPPIPVFEKAVSMFPTLSFVNMTCQDYLAVRCYKGEITAAGVNLVKDEEALAQHDEDMKAGIASSERHNKRRKRLKQHADNLVLIAMKTIGEDVPADEAIARLAGMSEADAAEAADSMRAENTKIYRPAA